MDRAKDSVFRKADLHVHTPRSMCYRDRTAALKQILDTASGRGLEVMAITDHNTVAAMAEIADMPRNGNLFIFPGVEVTTREGHVLAIFELGTPVPELENFLEDIGTSREGRGDGTTLARCGLEEVCQKIEERGGLAIAAHIDRWPSGFLETNEPREAKLRIHDSPHISALEITIPQNRTLWNAGEMRGYPKKYACVQSSDAHALADIGRRPVYIQMEQVGLAALRAAFLDYTNRIVFPGECAPG